MEKIKFPLLDTIFSSINIVLKVNEKLIILNFHQSGNIITAYDEIKLSLVCFILLFFLDYLNSVFEIV